MLLFIFLNNCVNAFSFNCVSLLSIKALSLTDFIAKFKDAKKFDTNLHSLISFVFYVKWDHLLNNFFCPLCVVLINWITARFFMAWAFSNSFLIATYDLFIVDVKKSWIPLSNFKKLSYPLGFLGLYGIDCNFLKAIMTIPALDNNNLFKKFLCISTIFLFYLNLEIEYLTISNFPFFNKFSKTFNTLSFWFNVIFSFNFSILLISLHLLKHV